MRGKDSSTFNEKINLITILSVVGLWIVMVSLTFTLAFYEYRSIIKDLELSTTNKFMFFKNELENMISLKISLLQGFNAYIETYDIYKEKDVYTYLDNLLNDNLDVIRNVAIIKDTTIIWNYPLEQNRASIGIDLSTVDKQADKVNTVKNTLQLNTDGPLNLVQGGKGIIIRVPILKDGNYWGMTSIVLDLDKINKLINNAAERYEINITIINGDNNEVIYGDKKLLNSKPLLFKNNLSNFNWNIYVIPAKGWNNVLHFSLIITIVIGLALSVLVTRWGYIRIINHFRVNQLNSTLEKIAYKDTLTGINSRNYFDTTVRDIIHSIEKVNKPVSLIYFDIDHFKKVNDTYGHDEGDKVLIETTSIISKLLRQSDIFIRWGGEEFIIVMLYTNLKGAIITAEKLRHEIEGTVFENIGNITISFGVSEKVPGEFYESWIKRTDDALYRSKATGRNKVSVSSPKGSIQSVVQQVKWNNEWLCGHKELDKQHQSIVAEVNILIKELYHNKNYNINLSEESKRLQKMLSDHFRSEEQILKENNYYDYTRHLNEHQKVEAEFNRLYQDIKQGKINIEDFYKKIMEDIIIGHMVFEDTKFFPYINKDHK